MSADYSKMSTNDLDELYKHQRAIVLAIGSRNALSMTRSEEITEGLRCSRAQEVMTKIDNELASRLIQGTL